MLPDLSNILAWKPRRHGSGGNSGGVKAAACPSKPARGSASERAMTATSQQDADDASETESADSSQSGRYLFHRQQSTQKTDDEDESDDNNDELAGARKHQSHAQPQQPPALRSMYSLARAGFQSSKMLLNKTRSAPQAAPAAHFQQQQQQAASSARAPATRRKPHSRSVDELSESDFLPLATGTRVSTPFGLGTVLEVRARDGVTVVRLQRSHPNAVAAPATLFLRDDDDDCHAVPALVNDLVVTPAGSARVLSYNAQDQFYDVAVQRSGGNDTEYTTRVRASDVRRRNAATGTASRSARRMRFHSMELHDQIRTSARSGRNSGSGRNSSGAANAPPKLARGLSTAIRTVVGASSSVSTSTMNFISNKYYQGQPVITKYGAGTIAAVLAADEPASGPNSSNPAAGRILQVELEWGAVAYLHADAITSYPKALVGMDVSTKFGAGVVLELRAEDAIYTVRLRDEQPVGTSDIVYVPESDLHRVGKLAATVGSVHKQMRGKLSALAQRLGHERVVVMHLRDDEISSAGI